MISGDDRSEFKMTHLMSVGVGGSVIAIMFHTENHLAENVRVDYLGKCSVKIFKFIQEFLMLGNLEYSKIDSRIS